MTTTTDAHMLELLASYEECLKLTTRAFETADALAHALQIGVRPADLPAQRAEITRSLVRIATLREKVSEFKAFVSGALRIADEENR